MYSEGKQMSFKIKSIAAGLTAYLVAFLLLTPTTAWADVTESSKTGFRLASAVDVELDSIEAYEVFVEDFSKWYDVGHSYTGKAENLTLDFEKSCMFEKLPDGGFVRHMEIVFHQPGKMLRLTGGLGPLQEMGVAGALTFAFEQESGARKTKVRMTYVVSGADFLALEQLAAPVNAVLADQLRRFRQHCETSKAE